jgi:Protein of unknown function (DUF4238)
MGESIQSHYLPKSAYLSFFENTEKKGHLYLYQRGSAPVLISIRKAARERNLYSFRDKDGHLDSEIEQFLERIESESRPILEKLNTATESFDVPAEEWANAAKFVAFQYVRTPAFRRQWQEITAEMMKATMRRVAKDDRMFQRAIKSTLGSNTDFPNIGSEKLRTFILSEDYNITAKGDYFLGLVLKAAEPIYRGVLVKTPMIYRSTNQSFVTCDSPVILLRHPKSPPHWGAGWINSHALLPIGKHAGLFLQAQPGHVRKMEGPVHIKVRKAGSRLAWMNKYTVNAAERFVFADKPLKAIVRLFSATKKPTRFKISDAEGSPFIMVRQS